MRISLIQTAAAQLQNAMGVARLDGPTIVRVSKEPYALLWGGLIFSVAFITPDWLLPSNVETKIHFISLGDSVLLIKRIAPWKVLGMMLVWFVVCHMVSGGTFRGNGGFLRALRPLLLGSIVLWIGFVPIVGHYVGAIWWAGLIFKQVVQDVGAAESNEAAMICWTIPLTVFLFGAFLSLAFCGVSGVRIVNALVL